MSLSFEDGKERHHFPREAKQYHKGTPQHPRKKSKPLTDYLIFQGCCQIGLSIKIQNTLISQAKRDNFNRTPNFANVLCFSTAEPFSSAEVILFRTSQVPWGKNPEHLFYRATFSGCFRQYLMLGGCTPCVFHGGSDTLFFKLGSTALL